jgi:hypothetical protein
MNKRKRFLVLVMLLAVGLVGCLPPSSPPTAAPTPPPPATLPPPPSTTTPLPPPPAAPVINLPGPEITVEAGKTISVRASAEGADKYEWTLMGKGEISASTGPAVLYTAPKEGDVVAILTVTAYNAQGASPQTSLTINVPPIAAAVVIRLDALAIPAGWMSGGSNPASFIKLEASPSNCHTGADCTRFTYSTGGGWGGIYWWPLTCGESGTAPAWDKVRGGTCGVNVLTAGNLSSVKRLTFWARGERGGEAIEFKIGGVDINPMPGRSTGKITLERDWKSYEIDLENMDLTNAVGLFLWIASDADNPNGAVFYLDDAQFEGVK